LGEPLDFGRPEEVKDSKKEYYNYIAQGVMQEIAELKKKAESLAR
jgi:hypothetical protein